MELFDDRAKAATCFVQEMKASLESCALLRLVAFVDGVMPDFPEGDLAEERGAEKAEMYHWIIDLSS
jgi:hypothetical protein